VSGYDEGSLLDGTYKRTLAPREPTGRIKCGTEANGGFKNITISNCIFEYCSGLALEEVDGGPMEDITVTNLTMREIVNAPIFIRIGARLRGPNNPPVGVARRIKISNVVATDVSPDHGILIVGIPGHTIDDVSLSNILIEYRGGGTKEQAAREVPEYENEYPEPGRFGILPTYGMFARHVKGLSLDHVEVRYAQDEQRPPFFLQDVTDADFDHVKARMPPMSPRLCSRTSTASSCSTAPACPTPATTSRWIAKNSERISRRAYPAACRRYGSS
jgi:hypothetical protein